MKHGRFSNTTRTAFASFAALATALVLSFVISCAPPGGSGSPGQAANGKYDHLDADEKVAMSEVLADDGEEKLGFGTMNEAWGLFSEALQLSPENHRAAFWREVLKPILEMKGILARVRPLYLKQHNGLERYKLLIKGIETGSDKDYYKFMTEGPSDIDTDEKFFEWIDREIVALDVLRTFIKANKERPMTLRAPVKVVETGKKKNDKCAALTIMTTKFVGCPETGMLNFKVNRADLEALQYVVSAQMIHLSLMFAYKINPVGLVENSIGSGRTFKEKVEVVTKGYDGSLLARNRLGLANSALADWIVAQKYVVQNQAELCKSGNRDADNRPGFMISSGICFGTPDGTTEKKTLELLEMIALGKPVEVEATYLKSPVMVLPLKFVNEPPPTLSNLLPTSFTPEGEALTFDDARFTPYFVAGTPTDLTQAMEVERVEDRAAVAKFNQAQLEAINAQNAAQRVLQQQEDDRRKREQEAEIDAAIKKLKNSPRAPNGNSDNPSSAGKRP